jgi:prepilin-type processing-associated H-X9-DG protein
MLDTTFSETGRIDMADISQGDGTATTILFSEKSQTGVTPQNWAAPHAAIASAPASLPVAFASLPVIGITQTPSESSLSNKPSSNHTSGSVVAFCDGHVIFLREDIAPWVYAQLISSKNSKAVYAITEWNPTGQILSGSDY